MEKEGKFDKVRRYLNYIDIATIVAGGLLGIPLLVGGGMLSIAADQSVGKEASRWLKKNDKKKNK